jgi:branched-chain amino acid transport system ATP-binding protein
MALKAADITVRFGGITALSNVELALHPGEILGLIGPNGAGKTTLVNVLSGFQRPHSGTIAISGDATVRHTSHHFARAGVARTFQAVRLFRGMTVAENVEVGCVSSGLSRQAARKRAMELLDWIGLAEHGHRLASTLSYGDERRVGVIRALALRPAFLLLDEPAAGLNASEADDLHALIVRIQSSFGCAVLLIEHNVALVMKLCHRIQVLESGRTIAVGTPAEVQAEPRVREAYLGSQAH